MIRALNNKEKVTLSVIKQMGYFPEIKETKNYKGEPEYWAEVIELKSWISLTNSPELNEIKNKKDHVHNFAG